MSAEAKTDYLLLFRGTDWLKQLSEAEFQTVVSDWAAWFERLNEEGRCKGGHPLLDHGKLVSGKQGRIVTDGPFAESKEAIGGFFHLHVADESEAIGIAQQCPGLEYGCIIEVRPLAERCTDRVRGWEASERDGTAVAKA